jgi:hypothetical protein
MEHLDTATLEDFKIFIKILHPQQCCFSSEILKNQAKDGSKNTLAIEKASTKKQTFIENR